MRLGVEPEFSFTIKAVRAGTKFKTRVTGGGPKPSAEQAGGTGWSAGRPKAAKPVYDHAHHRRAAVSLFDLDAACGIALFDIVNVQNWPAAPLRAPHATAPRHAW